MNLAIDVSVAVWHAFSALDEHKTGQVPKSKLKVFTASIGTLLGYKNAEDGLNEHRSTSYLNFDDFMYYINKELLSFPPGSLDHKDAKKYQSHIEELSWLVCRKNFLNRDYVAFPDTCVYQLFRIFCMLAQLVRTTDGGTSTSEVVMVADEVEHVAATFVNALGTQGAWDSADFAQIAQVLPTFRFSVFLALLETRYAKNVPVSGLTEAARDIHDLFVEDVLKKGTLSKKIPVVGKMRERWFVLQPSVLSFYSNREEGDKKGEIAIDPKCLVESCMDTNAKIHVFQLTSGDKKFEFNAADFKSKSQWISALHLAIKESNNKMSYQKMLAQKRKSERETILQKKMEDEKRDEQARLQAKKHQEEIQAEQLSRRQAEEKWKEEMRLRLKEEEKRKTLEETKVKLEEQLQKEKQATRDEEIVRALQARMLNEEWKKIEDLENSLREHRDMIENEKQLSQKLEEEKAKHINAFNTCQSRLRHLESEKSQDEKQLKELREKATIAERAKDILEAKLKVRERDLQQVNANTNQLQNNNKNLVCSR